MTCFEALDLLTEKGKGYLLTSRVLESGISKPTLAEYVKSRKMERVGHGVYLAKEALPDELYLLSLANHGIVFSHETALFLHGLMEREPKYISVTVKAGYNATHLRKKGILVYQIKKDLVELGVTELQTGSDHTVRAYDMERTICDILRHKNSMDVQIFQYAMKEYMRSTRKNLNHLMEYAKKLRIESVVRLYTEVML